MNYLLSLRRAARIGLVCISALLNAACPAPEPTSTENPPAQVPTTRPRPIKAAILLDKSGSAKTSGIPSLALKDLAGLIERVSAAGGEIAIGVITANSTTTPLVRVSIPAPPTAPAPAVESTNPLTAADARRKRAPLLAQYASARAAWEVDVAMRIEEFRSKAGTLLDAPANSRKTDIIGAVVRAERFLTEPSGPWSASPRLVAVFLTDARHNATKERTCTWSVPDAEVLLVNGERDAGVLSRLNPVRFESVQAALVHIVQEN